MTTLNALYDQRAEAHARLEYAAEALQRARSIDAAAPALNQARSHAALTTQAMATLEAAHVQRVAELQAAERAVIEAVDQILCDEDIAAAREVSYHLNEAARLGAALLHLAVAMELHGRGPQPSEVTEVLSRLDVPLIDRHDIAINLMKQ